MYALVLYRTIVSKTGITGSVMGTGSITGTGGTWARKVAVTVSLTCAGLETGTWIDRNQFLKL